MAQEYRNKQELITEDGEYVEAGSLWQYVRDRYILVDEDRYVTHTNPQHFTKA